jgi:excisionase family DNA binding protein
MQPRSAFATVEQAAEYLQVHRTTVIEWIKAGKFPASKLGRAYRIAVADLDDFIQKGKVA